jgi:hypothetical protein
MSRGKFPHISRRASAISSSVMCIFRSAHNPRRLRRGFFGPRSSLSGSPQSLILPSASQEANRGVSRQLVVQSSWQPLGRSLAIISPLHNIGAAAFEPAGIIGTPQNGPPPFVRWWPLRIEVPGRSCFIVRFIPQWSEPLDVPSDNSRPHSNAPLQPPSPFPRPILRSFLSMCIT